MTETPVQYEVNVTPVLRQVLAELDPLALILSQVQKGELDIEAAALKIRGSVPRNPATVAVITAARNYRYARQSYETVPSPQTYRDLSIKVNSLVIAVDLYDTREIME